MLASSSSDGLAGELFVLKHSALKPCPQQDVVEVPLVRCHGATANRSRVLLGSILFRDDCQASLLRASAALRSSHLTGL